MIIETIVTTVDQHGQWNIAPMGPHIDDHWEREPSTLPNFILRPFAGSVTHENLMSSRRAVIHFSSDAGLFARSAIAAIRGDAAIEQTIATASADRRLKHCERYFVVTCEVQQQDEVQRQDPVRPTLRCQIIDHGVVDPPRGLNRASAAVIEAAVLATRLDRLGRADVQKRFDDLRTIVEKTGGEISRHAFHTLSEYLDSYRDRVIDE